MNDNAFFLLSITSFYFYRFTTVFRAYRNFVKIGHLTKAAVYSFSTRGGESYGKGRRSEALKFDLL